MALLFVFFLVPTAYATNQNLIVSAENSDFSNHFTGSMVVEVVVDDPNLNDLDEGKGEPDVTINGKTLRMVQATDGNWYAYFANLAKAQIADSTVGLAGRGLDFGVFCSRDTAILGASFTDSDGVAVPRNSTLSGFTNGVDPLTECTGSVEGNSTNINNVVRRAKSINTNPSVASGQIGLDKDAWPIIQLFTFDDVTIQYNKGGGTQRVDLEYDESQNISLQLDRDLYPTNSEVFITIADMQLNQDPTSRDSWTFNVNDTAAVFYQAFDENGNDAANGAAGLVNLRSSLSSLDFEKNGVISMNLNSIVQLQTNDKQPDSTVSDGTTSFSKIITFVESEPNTGIFENFDDSDVSVIGITSDAPRGTSATITYNSKSSSIVTGSATSSLSIDSDSSLVAGKKVTVIITDSDQNINSGARDDLDVYRSAAIIPNLQIGSPVTLEKASDFQFYEFSTSDLESDGISVASSVPDTTADRLIVDSTDISNTDFEKISVNLGASASTLQSLLIDSDSAQGTNWINFDLRSFERQLGVSDFSDTSISLYFGLDDTSPVTIVDSGDIDSAQDLVQIDDSDIDSIESKSGDAYLVINFDDSDNSSVGEIDSETDTQPIVVDFFSFGLRNGNEVNNAIYRFELEETSSNSGKFEGTMEYVIASQLNILDPELVETLQTIDDEVKFLVNDKMIDEEGIAINYSDLSQEGTDTPVSTKSDIPTTSGVVTVSPEYRIGRTVAITINDPDLNARHDTIESFFVINDPASENVDTIGSISGEILAEVLIKDVRYQRCTINGVEHGGLAASGFALIETGPDTGKFEGTFKMPAAICNESGTELMSIKGGTVEVKYHDFSDYLGERNIYSSKDTPYIDAGFTPPTLDQEKFDLPRPGQTTEVVLSGKVGNYKQGTTIQIIMVYPDGTVVEHTLRATSSGNYRGLMTLDSNSKVGKYDISVNYLGASMGSVSFEITKPAVPDWIKNNAGWWSEGTIGNSDFTKGIEHMVNEGIIHVPDVVAPADVSQQNIPDWIKNNAGWWSEGLISEDDFLNGIKFMIEKKIIALN